MQDLPDPPSSGRTFQAAGDAIRGHVVCCRARVESARRMVQQTQQQYVQRTYTENVLAWVDVPLASGPPATAESDAGYRAGDLLRGYRVTCRAGKETRRQLGPGSARHQAVQRHFRQDAIAWLEVELDTYRRRQP